MLTYTDFPIGHAFALGPRQISADEIIRFAQKYDPQPLHLDGESSQAQLVGGLIASGWHTCSIAMRMMCDSYLLDTISQGSGGLSEVKWLHPVRPNDILSGTATVIDRRVSRSNPALGIVTFKYVLQNQDTRQVLAMTGMGMVSTGPAELQENAHEQR